jgi:hypothetical protein
MCRYFVLYTIQMFLKQLYHQWRAMFWVVLLFIIAQVFFICKGIENTPFFLYNMFSTVHTKKEKIPIYLIKTTNGYFNPFNNSNRAAEMLLNNIDLYQYMQQHQYVDPIFKTIQNRFGNKITQQQLHTIIANLCNDSMATAAYPTWWGNYFSSIQVDKKQKIELIKTTVIYYNMLQKSNIDSTIFYSYIK